MFSFDSASGLFLSRYYGKNFSELMMLRRNLLLFATLGSLPNIETKGEKKTDQHCKENPILCIPFLGMGAALVPISTLMCL
jgi:hypothetical protein